MRTIYQRIRALIRDERGQDLIEYALMCMFCVASIMLVIPDLSESFALWANKMNTLLTSALF
ncbi:MAG: hypothetical protein IPM24_02860 [Bryobacterales bacterium]|nr:hypothetical protein [Bryobacterales bacterium]